MQLASQNITLWRSPQIRRRLPCSHVPVTPQPFNYIPRDMKQNGIFKTPGTMKCPALKRAKKPPVATAARNDSYRGTATAVLDTTTYDSASILGEVPTAAGAHARSKASSSLSILFLTTAHNSMSQRLYLELRQRGHKVTVSLAISEEAIMAAVHQAKFDVVVCPFLTKKIPHEIYANNICLVVHPGIVGDRGPHSLDWALHQQRPVWGVTVLQADDEMDAGPIWATRNVSTVRPHPGSLTKSSLYRHEIVSAAVEAVDEALNRLMEGMEGTPLDYSNVTVHGSLMRNMKQADRSLDWSEPAHDLAVRVRTSDSVPGSLCTIAGRQYFAFNCLEEDINSELSKAVLLASGSATIYSSTTGSHAAGHNSSRSSQQLPAPAAPRLAGPPAAPRLAGPPAAPQLAGPPAAPRLAGPPAAGSIVGMRDGAICVQTGEGLLWLGHLKPKDPLPHQHKFKLPATIALHGTGALDSVPDLSLGHLKPPMDYPWHGRFMPTPHTWQEIWRVRDGAVCYVNFEFYNGAMSTRQCEALVGVLKEVAVMEDVKVVVLMGGCNFWSNGIHLNVIEAAEEPAYESWLNINAIDDVVREVLSMKGKVTVAALQGNAGAGGAMAMLAADLVWAHPGVVLNPHYKTMGLFGSEYWTYLLPKRAGDTAAQVLIDTCQPISAQQASQLGLVDAVLNPVGVAGLTAGFQHAVRKNAHQLVNNQAWIQACLDAKERDFGTLEAPGFVQAEACRERELTQMREDFKSVQYQNARYAFVHKVPPVCTCGHVNRSAAVDKLLSELSGLN